MRIAAKVELSKAQREQLETRAKVGGSRFDWPSVPR
jgi:hypothetical protein